MTTFAAKTKNAETESAKSKGVKRKSNDLQADSINTSASLFGFPIQRKADCACGGSCPRCQNESANLPISHPNDASEIEADRVADKVMRMVEPEALSSTKRSVQSKMSSGNSTFNAPSLASDVTSSSLGKSLDESTRSFMESRFNHDFSDVKIFDNEAAAKSANLISARAYTLGNNIVFNSGQYNPNSDAGRRLLAHELAHVGQQRNGNMQIQRDNTTDVRIAEGYNQRIADIKASAKFQSLTLDEVKLVDAIIVEIEKNTDWSTRSFFAFQLQILFERTAKKADLDAAKASIKTLKLDKAKVNALLETLSKPLLGYVASGFDFSSRFFKHAGSLGFKVENAALTSFKASPYDKSQPASVTDPAEESFKKSDILFFSGHQYAQYKEPGTFTNDASNACFNIRMISKANKRVKLVASTSCATICEDVAEIWMSKFPDALILGYRFSAPLNGAIVSDAFAKQLQAKGPINLSDAGGLQLVRDAWKSVVLGKGSVEGGPGLLYNGEVEIWVGGKWVKKPSNDKANICHYH